MMPRFNDVFQPPFSPHRSCLVAMNSIEIKTPAKVNLYLKVLKRRVDGYHEIESLMVPVELFDKIWIEKEKSGIQVNCPAQKELSGRANLAFKAATLWARWAKVKPFGVKIRIEKKIPIQAGLAGGSSDAAATMLGLQRLFDSPLTFSSLEKCATQLGADVPFFLQKGPQWAKGIGERLTPAKLPPFCVLLACPNYGLKTRQVFENLKFPLTSIQDDVNHENPDSGIESLSSKVHNDLQSTSERIFPEIGQVAREMLRAGAMVTSMSGSGPSVFGVCKTREAALEVLRRVRKNQAWTYLVLRAII
jgi:4-diphosphocytidyl-2-C-methyl-D-erythritol kinase